MYTKNINEKDIFLGSYHRYADLIAYNKSPLPLTDPYDAVTHAQLVVHRCRQLVSPRPSPVYHTDHPPKLTAPEMISRFRDMVGAKVPTKI